MNNLQFDIIRQTGWDLWLWVCIAASLVLLSYAAFTRPWKKSWGWLSLSLIAGGVGGTLLVLVMPSLHTPLTGLIWTTLLLCMLAATFYLNILNQLGVRRMGWLLGMRIVALVLLVPMLFEPVARYVLRNKPDRPLMFLIDTSGSMSFPDVQNGPTRLQSVWQILQQQLDRINSHFVPSYFTFSTGVSELNRPDELARLQADGKATDIVSGLAKVLESNRRLDAAVVLISDGIDNVSPSVVNSIRAVRRPIHTVWVGSEQAEPASVANIAVDNVESSDDFTVGHENKVKATIKSVALANRLVDVKMSEIDASGKTIGETVSQKLVLSPVAEGQTVELIYKPPSVGAHRLAVWVDPVPGERSTADNRQEFQGLALNPRIKVLYVEGRARPEYRDLNRAMMRDTNIELASLLRIKDQRFAASGTVDGTPFQEMPRTAEGWKNFDVIILGDLDGSFLGAAAQIAIEQRVAEGGGLLMMGGQNSFGPGSYKDTPIEKALPVFVGDSSAAQEKSEFVPRLTAEGMAHPAMEGLAEWFGSENSAGAKSLPPIRGNVVVPKPKSGAQVLLVHHDRPGPDGKPQIVLAVQRYGKGQSAAFTADTTYLWYLPLRGLGQDSPYNRFWGQLVRWLAGEDVRNRQRGAGVEGLLNKNVYQFGESVRIRAMVRDDKGDATRYAQVSLRLRSGGQKDAKQFPLTPSVSRTGMYDVVVPNLEKGDWSAELIASKDGKELGRQELKLTVIPPADEMLKTAANPRLMAEIAEQTRGFSYSLAQFPSLVEQLIRSDPKANVAKQQTLPLSNTFKTLLALFGYHPQWDKKYDLPTQGLIVLALLAGEWIMRRRWQLP